MSDILTQEEVDALLNAVSSGGMSSDDFGGPDPETETPTSSGGSSQDSEEKERQVSLYDFRRPDRVSKDQMRALQNLHDGYARLLATTLSSYLRALVEIDIVSVDQLTYSEFVMSVSNPSCIYVFQMEPLEGAAIVEVNPNLVFLIVDRLFGGQGKPSDHNRELTDIEKNVLTKIVDRALANLKEIWEHVGIFTPRIDSYETNAQFVQIAPPNETVILISLEVRMKHGSGLISLCFPYILLETVIDKLSRESWISGQRTTTQETRRLIETELTSTQLPLSAVIGETSLSIRDLLQLQTGDVVVLEKPAQSDLVLQVGGKAKYLGRAGLVGRHKSIQVTAIIEKEVGEDG
jgi:flagellar motor switch protein FliM